MSSSTPSPHRVRACIAATVLAPALLGGCTVLTVAGTAASVTASGVGLAASGVGLAADAAVGTVRLTGKAVGAVLPGSTE